METTTKKRSLLSSIFAMKCPRCREGDLFETGTFSFQKPLTMPHHCPKCGQVYMPEPGFYYGAMFISYAIWGWFTVLTALGLVYLAGWSVNQAFVLLLVLSAIFFVWVFRISRTIWFHIDTKYEAGSIEQYQKTGIEKL